MSSVQVQGTNDSSTLSKQSMVNLGYFEDEYISFFCQKSSRRSPLINIGYFVRAKIIESALMFYLDILGNANVQILSLGAGFDTSYFRLYHKLKDTKYIEVDFPDVVFKKLNCVKQNKRLSEMLCDFEETQNSLGGKGLRSEKFVLIPQDLANLTGLEESLLSNGFNFQKPTLLLSECSITYMEEAKSTHLISWTGSRLRNAVFLTYEQINPDDGFGLVMKNHFKNIHSPLKSVDNYKSLEDQRQRYLSCGWESCSSICAFDAYSRLLSEAEHNRILHLEPFDEWEEWHLKCCHYAITLATNGSLTEAMLPFINRINGRSKAFIVQRLASIKWILHKDFLVERFGHCVVPLAISDDILLVVGGVAKSETNQHLRAKHLSILMPEKQLQTKNIAASFECEGMYHTCPVICSSLSRTDFIVYGGRLSPLKPVNTCPTAVIVKIEDRSSTGSQNVDISTELIKVESLQPCHRWRHTLDVVENALILFGGRNSQLEVLGDLWILDLNLASKKWQMVESGTLPESRFSHSSVANGSKLFISGGLSSEFKPLSDVWEYDKQLGLWNEINIVGVLPRYSHTIHMVNNFIILIGGVNTLCSNQPGIGLVNLSTGTCLEFSLPVGDPEMPIMLHNHASILSVDGRKIYILGGGGNCFSFGTSFNKCLIEIPLHQFMLNDFTTAV